MLGCPKIGIREKYITGCLLTEMLDRITNRTPVDITMMKIPKQVLFCRNKFFFCEFGFTLSILKDFDVTRHITFLQERQAKYPPVASMTAPAILRILNEEAKNQYGLFLRNEFRYIILIERSVVIYQNCFFSLKTNLIKELLLEISSWASIHRHLCYFTIC